MHAILKFFTFLLATINVIIALHLDVKAWTLAELGTQVVSGDALLMLWLEHLPILLLCLWALTTAVVAAHNKLTTGFYTSATPRS